MFIGVILNLYSRIRKLCQFVVGKYDKNKLKEIPQSTEARHSHYLS